MEKIQHAIAKARELREAQIQEGGVDSLSPETGDQDLKRSHAATAVQASTGQVGGHMPTTAAAAVMEPVTVDISKAWEAVPEIKVNTRRLRRNRILTGMGGKEAAEFDMIRTRIIQAQKANGWRRIAITSPNPSCGKSTLVMNLAFSFARQPEQRTLIAEADLRRPSIAKTLGVSAGYNFAAVLGRSETFEDNSFRIGSNLIMSTNEKPAQNPAELLQSDRAESVLKEIDDTYAPTMTIFDMPPMLVGDDAMGFLPNVDAAILVAAAEQTTMKQIDLCERDIASQTNVLGIVLNKCRYMDRDQSYGYQYY